MTSKYFDEALHDLKIVRRETPEDVARRLGALLHHVAVTHPGVEQGCTTCDRAVVYASFFGGGSLKGPYTEEG